MLIFDGFDEATDDDFEIEGALGLLSGGRAVFRVTVDWLNRGDHRSEADSVTCHLLRLETVDAPHVFLMDRGQALNLFGMAAVHGAERAAEETLLEQIARGKAA